MTELWIPKPDPSIWQKLKCYFGFHKFDGPYSAEQAAEDSFYYCKGKCSSHIRWEKGLPRYGVVTMLGKLKSFMVENVFKAN